MANITKKDIVDEIAERTGLKQVDVKVIVEQFLDEIVAAVSEGGNIEIRGFGRFKVKPRAGRVARNPRTGETVEIAEGIKPVFEPSKELKSMIESKNIELQKIELPVEKKVEDNG